MIKHKSASEIRIWLSTALKMEQQKYEAVPVKPDMVPDYEVAQAWGYVVTGYFLIEQGIKAILAVLDIVRKSEPEEQYAHVEESGISSDVALKTHSLSKLFGKMPESCQVTLRSYYDDFIKMFPGIGLFPIRVLDEFLVNLDGGLGKSVGSFDWRYFPTQEGEGAQLPHTSVDIMHELVHGCVQIIESIDLNNDNVVPTSTYSQRAYWERLGRYRDWLEARMNSPGWKEQGDRLEILWGPDYADKYGYLVFVGREMSPRFARLPDAEKLGLVVIDRRGDLNLFSPMRGRRYATR